MEKMQICKLPACQQCRKQIRKRAQKQEQTSKHPRQPAKSTLVKQNMFISQKKKNICISQKKTFLQVMMSVRL